MAALFSFFVILIISLTIVRVSSIMLELTGISTDMARFQARSAFTGSGFTTRESENIVNHPVRRKVISSLMLIGNIGFVTFVSSLVLSFLTISTQEKAYITFGTFIGGLLLLLLLSRSRLLNLILQRLTEKLLKRWSRIHIYDYESLLNLAGNFEVINIQVKPENWMADAILSELKLSDEGILVLAVRRSDGYFLGSPRGETVLYSGDEVTVYGREDALKNLMDRRKGSEGDLQHSLEVEQQMHREGRRIESKEQAPQTETKGLSSLIGRVFKRKE